MEAEGRYGVAGRYKVRCGNGGVGGSARLPACWAARRSRACLTERCARARMGSPLPSFAVKRPCGPLVRGVLCAPRGARTWRRPEVGHEVVAGGGGCGVQRAGGGLGGRWG